MAETTPNRRPPKKKSRTGLIVGIVLAALLGSAIAAMVLRDSDGEGVLVETEKVQRRNITQTVYGRGTIDPETQLVISSEVSGEIVFLGAKEGDVVQKGQVLVKINPQSMLAQQSESQAAISAAQARLASATCHKPRQSEPRADFDRVLAARMGIQERSILAIARSRHSAGAFRHGGETHAALSCGTCHAVDTINTADPKTQMVAMTACAGCHATPGVADGGILNIEMEKKRKSATFECSKLPRDIRQITDPAVTYTGP